MVYVHIYGELGHLKHASKRNSFPVKIMQNLINRNAELSLELESDVFVDNRGDRGYRELICVGNT